MHGGGADGHADGLIGPWDLAAAVDTRAEGGDAAAAGTDAGSRLLAPRPGHQSFIWVVDGQARYTGDEDLDAVITPGEVGAVTLTEDDDATAVRVAGEGFVGARLDAIAPGLADDGILIELDEPDVFTLRSVTTAEVGEARVFVGEMFGQASPIATASPMVAAEIRLSPGAEIAFTLEESFAYGLLALTEGFTVQRTEVPRGEVAYTQPGGRTWGVINRSSGWGRAIIFGGEPVGTEHTERTGRSEHAG